MENSMDSDFNRRPEKYKRTQKVQIEAVAVRNWARWHILKINLKNLKMEQDFKGKTYVVTGAGRGNICFIFFSSRCCWPIFLFSIQVLAEKLFSAFSILGQKSMHCHWNQWMTWKPNARVLLLFHWTWRTMQTQEQHWLKYFKMLKSMDWLIMLALPFANHSKNWRKKITISMSSKCW